MARTQSEQQELPSAPFPLHEDAHQLLQRAQPPPPQQQQQLQLQDTLMQLQELCMTLSQQLQQTSSASPQ